MLCSGSLIAGIVIDRYNTSFRRRPAGSMYARGVDFSIETDKHCWLVGVRWDDDTGEKGSDLTVHYLQGSGG